MISNSSITLPAMDSAQEINSNNFYHRNWTKGRRSIKLHQCLIPIVSRTFDIIQNLCFSHDILFENLITMLRNAPNLRFVSFENPVLNDFKPFAFASSDELIRLPELRHLWFHNTRPLGKNDYWLLDFFTHVVQMKKLKSFHFRMEKNPTEKFSCLEQTTNAITEKYGPAADYAIVGKFIIANQSTLADLSLGGEGFKLEGLSKQETEQMKQLKLSNLLCSFDTEGIEDILEDQRKVKHLAFKDIDKKKLNWELVSKSIKHAVTNLKTLKDFSMYFYSELENDPTPPDIVYNGEDFRKCYNLQSLILGIVTSFDNEKIAPEFIRIHSLPRKLAEISITCQDINRNDFDLLGNFIHEFKNLQRFYLCTLSATKYSLKLDWIRGLKCLGNFQEAEFVNVEHDREQIFFMKTILVPEFQKDPKIDLIDRDDCLQLVRRSIIELDKENRLH